MSSLDAKRLYALLPAIHRIRDDQQGRPLEALVSLIAQEFEAASREAIRARLGHRIDRRARLDPALRGEAAGRHLEFLEPGFFYLVKAVI